MHRANQNNPHSPAQIIHDTQDISEWDTIEAASMACPALPLCGLAISEAERALPAVNERIRATMNRVGLSKQDTMIVRMTGSWCRCACTVYVCCVMCVVEVWGRGVST